MTTHSSTLAWKIPWTEEPGRLQSLGSQTVGHDWVTSLSTRLGISLSPPALPSISMTQKAYLSCKKNQPMLTVPQIPDLLFYRIKNFLIYSENQQSTVCRNLLSTYLCSLFNSETFLLFTEILVCISTHNFKLSISLDLETSSRKSVSKFREENSGPLGTAEVFNILWNSNHFKF